MPKYSNHLFCFSMSFFPFQIIFFNFSIRYTDKGGTLDEEEGEVILSRWRFLNKLETITDLPTNYPFIETIAKLSNSCHEFDHQQRIKSSFTFISIFYRFLLLTHQVEENHSQLLRPSFTPKTDGLERVSCTNYFKNHKL